MMADAPTSQPPEEESAPQPRRGFLFRLVRIAVLSYIGIAVLMMSLERFLVFPASRYPAGFWGADGITIEDVYFESSDGVKLHGWLFPHDNPSDVVLFAHGNGGNLTHWKEYLNELRERFQVSVFIFDYRGYGRSEGKPTEAGILADAEAARDWLANRENIAHKEMLIFGQSLGGAVAVDLAARGGARALVLDRTFDALPEVAAAHYPWLPVRWLMRTRLNARDKISNYQGPLLQIHGDVDKIVPIANGRRLFDAANEPKKFVRLSGFGHNDYPAAEYFEVVGEFLAQLGAGQALSE